MRLDRALLRDMLDAIDEVIDTLPATREAFDADKYVCSHILRHVQIIGEAGWRLSDAVKAQHLDIPWKQMAGMRHVLVHDYFEVNWARVYDTAREDVPKLKPMIEAAWRACPPDDTPGEG